MNGADEMANEGPTLLKSRTLRQKFEIMKSHTQKKSEITLFENENRKTPYISVNYGRIELRDIINWNITEVI